MTADNVAHLKNTICQELKAVIILLIHLPDQFVPQAGVYVCVCVSSLCTYILTIIFLSADHWSFKPLTSAQPL